MRGVKAGQLERTASRLRTSRGLIRPDGSPFHLSAHQLKSNSRSRSNSGSDGPSVARAPILCDDHLLGTLCFSVSSAGFQSVIFAQGDSSELAPGAAPLLK